MFVTAPRGVSFVGQTALPGLWWEGGHNIKTKKEKNHNTNNVIPNAAALAHPVLVTEVRPHLILCDAPATETSAELVVTMARNQKALIHGLELFELFWKHFISSLLDRKAANDLLITNIRAEAVVLAA